MEILISMSMLLKNYYSRYNSYHILQNFNSCIKFKSKINFKIYINIFNLILIKIFNL